MRLSKMLARAGIASRRKAEALIREGRVTVNGRKVLELSAKVVPGVDIVRVDGKIVRWRFSPIYILLNKPKGIVTTMNDPLGRPTVKDLLKGIQRRVFPVGRLDFDTEGALLLTNDGELAHKLMHPSYGIERTYEAKVKGIPTQEAIHKLREGVVVGEGEPAKAKVRILKVLKANSWLEIKISQGRYREVRRMCEAVGHPVLALRRTRFGPISIKGLPKGSFRHLTPAEVKKLKELTSTKKSDGMIENGKGKKHIASPQRKI